MAHSACAKSLRSHTIPDGPAYLPATALQVIRRPNLPILIPVLVMQETKAVAARGPWCPRSGSTWCWWAACLPSGAGTPRRWAGTVMDIM